MSNIIPANVQVPAHIAARMQQPSTLAAAVSGGISSGGGHPRISIKAARFRIIVDGEETVLQDTVLNAIIVGANPRLSKAYYTKAWTKDSDPEAPDCYSMDGVRPAADSGTPQNDACASCQWNAWGSRVADNGQQLKACADKKRLAIVAADDPDGPVYLLEVTPAALKGLNTYQRELQHRGIPAEVVVTKISFDTDASFPKLTFGFGGFIPEDAQAVVDKLFGSEEVKEITGEESSVSLPQQAPAPKAEPTPAPKPAPQPAPAPTPEPAPAPKAGFGKAKAAPAAPVAEAPKPAPQPAVAAANSDAASLAAEIEALINGGADDA